MTQAKYMAHLADVLARYDQAESGMQYILPDDTNTQFLVIVKDNGAILGMVVNNESKILNATHQLMHLVGLFGVLRSVEQDRLDYEDAELVMEILLDTYDRTYPPEPLFNTLICGRFKHAWPVQ